MTTGDGAAGDEDFERNSGTLNWADGDRNSKDIVVRIKEDTRKENNETLATVSLSPNTRKSPFELSSTSSSRLSTLGKTWPTPALTQPFRAQDSLAAFPEYSRSNFSDLRNP